MPQTGYQSERRRVCEVSDLDQYPSILSIPVQWGDMDALGHVNNTVPIRWFESSRISYMEQVEMDKMLDELGFGVILASVNCSYRRQMHYPDTVRVGCRVSRVGRTSITLHHIVFSGQLEQTAAKGESVIVSFDYANQRPVRVPEAIRTKLAQLHPDIPQQ